jgi:transcriptional regulator with XRE-family HTH domain
METVADRLRRLRAERYVSQAELAEQSGVGAATIARIELGMVKPRAGTVRKLAQALEVKPAELMTPAELLDRRSGKDAA